MISCVTSPARKNILKTKTQEVETPFSGGVLQTLTMQSKIFPFWILFCSVIFISAALEYSNRWTVQIDGDDAEADEIARKHGFVNLGKVSFQNSFLALTARITINRVAAFICHSGGILSVLSGKMRSCEIAF